MNIGLIAHDNKKKLMQNFCIAYYRILKQHELFATGATGRMIEEATNLTVHKFHAGNLGGGEQMAMNIENNLIDMVFFLQDPYFNSKNEPDIVNILKLCDLHNVPIATDLASSELLVLALERGDVEWRNNFK